MKRFILAALIGAALVAACLGQTYTSVTGTAVHDASGVLLTTGSICFQATDARDNPVGVQPGGTGIMSYSPYCAAITSGNVAGGFQVPNPSAANPSWISYRITVEDQNGVPLVVYRGVGFSGANWSFDANVANPGSAAQKSFSQVTTGTNSTALLMGTGGSLGTSGSGTIAATSVPASGLTGSLTTAQIAAAGTLSNATAGNAATATALAATPTTCSAGSYATGVLTSGNATGCTVAPTGTVTSVSVAPPSWLGETGSPITSSGTIRLSGATAQTSGRVVGTCNGATTTSLCQLATSDLPVGTSGATIPLLNGLNTWSGIQNFTGNVTTLPTVGISLGLGADDADDAVIYSRSIGRPYDFQLNTYDGGNWNIAMEVPVSTVNVGFPGGVLVGTPTGSYEGTGTLNATTLYQNGVALAPSATTDTTNATNITSGTLASARLPATIAANTTGNAATATALAANPTLCPSGDTAQGILASGAATGCAPTSGVFSGIQSGTNTTAAMVIGTGASLGVSGSGTIAATTSTQCCQTGSPFNIAVGTNPLAHVTTAQDNLAVGTNSLQGITSGTDDTAVGYEAATNITSASGETAVGSGVLPSDTSGGGNVAVGSEAAYSLTSGLNNVIVGTQTGSGNLTNGNYNVLLGYGTDTPSTGKSYYLNLGNSIVGDMSKGSLTLKGSLPSPAPTWTLTPEAFTSFPACGGSITGAQAVVTDSTTTTWGATVTGGGSSTVLMFCDGTNWTVAAK